MGQLAKGAEKLTIESFLPAISSNLRHRVHVPGRLVAGQLLADPGAPVDRGGGRSRVRSGSGFRFGHGGWCRFGGGRRFGGWDWGGRRSGAGCGRWAGGRGWSRSGSGRRLWSRRVPVSVPPLAASAAGPRSRCAPAVHSGLSDPRHLASRGGLRRVCSGGCRGTCQCDRQGEQAEEGEAEGSRRAVAFMHRGDRPPCRVLHRLPIGLDVCPGGPRCSGERAVERQQLGRALVPGSQLRPLRLRRFGQLLDHGGGDALGAFVERDRRGRSRLRRSRRVRWRRRPAGGGRRRRPRVRPAGGSRNRSSARPTRSAAAARPSPFGWSGGVLVNSTLSAMPSSAASLRSSSS